jgi:hypothetical protein
VRIDVRQDPGIRYPSPPNRAWIVEQTYPQSGAFVPPLDARSETIVSPGDPCCPY